ncbi:MAG: hypothetical protein ACTSRJ_03430 [Candidatus Hodarchaeales archaeon]
MPFINITFADAKLSLNDTSIIVELLKKQIINPKEANLLRKIHIFSQKRSIEDLKKVKDLCEQYFPSNPEEAFQKIKQFVESKNKRVSWVIFSRTFQSVAYDDRNPLDDYIPRVSEVLTIKSMFKAVK